MVQHTTTAGESTRPAAASMPVKPLAIAPHGIGMAELALALGGLAIGTAEFAAMGVLPTMASDLKVSVPQAGGLISAYALGVVVGAPTMTVLLARMPRRQLLIGLMLLYAFGNYISTVFHGFYAVMAARFISGLPHGVYFGSASLVAAAMVPPHKRGQAIGKVLLGLSVANVIGVPAATWLGQIWGWRATFTAVSIVALATAAMIYLFVPKVAAQEGASPLSELSAFKSAQVWLTLLAAATGFGGLFAVYSYVTPLLTHVTHLPLRQVPVMLALIGLGMVTGSFVCGWLADRWLKRTMVGLYLFTALILLVMAFVASHTLVMGLMLFLLGLAAMVTPAFQARLMDVADKAQALAASLNHSAFNIANALGAWLGGLAIAAGYGWTSTAWVGLGLSLVGTAVVLWSFGLERRASRQALVAG